MRLFTAIDLPEAILDTLAEFTVPLRSSLSARWSPRQNLHITTKFIGEWQQVDHSGILAVLAHVRSEPFELRLSGLGYFPRVLWVGVAPNPMLADLASQTDEVLAGIGSAREQRVYTPHLTLAREKPGTSLRHLKNLSLPTLPAFTVDSFHLFQSKAGVYTKLSSFGLVRSSK